MLRIRNRLFLYFGCKITFNFPYFKKKCKFAKEKKSTFSAYFLEKQKEKKQLKQVYQ